MSITRRDFVRNGVAAFTVSFAAPAFLSDIALVRRTPPPFSSSKLQDWQ